MLRHAGAILGMLTALGAAPWAWAAEEAPDALIQRLSTEVLDQLRNDKALKNGDIGRVISWSTARSCPTSTSPA